MAAITPESAGGVFSAATRNSVSLIAYNSISRR